MSQRPPRDDINWWPLYLGLIAICLPLMLWLFSMGGSSRAAGVLLVAPLAWVASRIVINGVEHLARAKREADWKDWQGINYAYGPDQLRALELDDALWFYEEDLLKVLKIKGDALTRLFPLAERKPLEGSKWHVLSEAGCEHLLLKAAVPEAGKLLMYLRREAWYPYKRAHGQAVEVPNARPQKN